MMIFAVNRLLADVVQGVVHPAHIPFEGKSEPSGLSGSGHRGPGGGLLDVGGGAAPMQNDIEMTQEFDGLQVLVTAVLIGHPLALLA